MPLKTGCSPNTDYFELFLLFSVLAEPISHLSLQQEQASLWALIMVVFFMVWKGCENLNFTYVFFFSCAVRNENVSIND